MKPNNQTSLFRIIKVIVRTHLPCSHVQNRIVCFVVSVVRQRHQLRRRSRSAASESNMTNLCIIRLGFHRRLMSSYMLVDSQIRSSKLILREPWRPNLFQDAAWWNDEKHQLVTISPAQSIGKMLIDLWESMITCIGLFREQTDCLTERQFVGTNSTVD